MNKDKEKEQTPADVEEHSSSVEAEGSEAEGSEAEGSVDRPEGAAPEIEAETETVPGEKGAPGAALDAKDDADGEPERGAGSDSESEKRPSTDGEKSPDSDAQEQPSPESEEPKTSDREKHPAPESRPVSHQDDRPASPRWLLLLALLVAIIALILAARLYMQQDLRVEQQRVLQERIDNEVERMSAMADDTRRAIDDSRQVMDNFRQTIEDSRQAVEDAIELSRRSNSELRTIVNDERARQQRELAEQRKAVAAVQESLQSQRQQIMAMRRTDQKDWSLAEAEYLLRLAFQRLLLAKDVNSAIAMLRNADAILRDLDDTELLPAREALARDLAALRAIPDVDVDGTWLRLQALADRVDSLLLFELGIDAAPADEEPEDAGWQERLEQGFTTALEKVSSYFVIRRREQPYETLIDPQWEQMVRQNLRMQIAQAQSALLSGNPELYRMSLTSTRRWLKEFFDFNQADVTAMEAELDALMAVQISREYPTIGESLKAVKAAIDARHSAQGGG